MINFFKEEWAEFWDDPIEYILNKWYAFIFLAMAIGFGLHLFGNDVLWPDTLK